MSRRVARRTPAAELAVGRELLILLEAAASLQEETDAALTECLDGRVARGRNLARTVHRLLSGYAYLIARIGQLPSSVVVDEAADLLRYHHMLLAETSRYAYNSPSVPGGLPGRSSGHLGAPAVRLRQLRDVVAGYLGSAESSTTSEKGWRVTLPAGLSHSFLTPLTTILGNASSLLLPDAGWDRPSERQLLGGIVSESGRLARVVDNVLSLALMTEGSLQPDFDWCDPAAVIQTAIARVDGSLALEERLRADIDLSAYAPPSAMLWADHDLLTRALVDLLDNAARHTPRASRVTMTTTASPGQLAISIEDQGTGLPRKVRAAVASSAASGGLPTGVGTGIPMAMGVIVLHGGSLSYPDMHSGTRSVIQLPLS